MSEIIKNPVNGKLGKLEWRDIVVIFVDIRDSTKLNNQLYNDHYNLLEIYNSFICNAVKIFGDSGFKYYQIQGDGIFAVGWEEDMNNNLVKCLEDLEKFSSYLHEHKHVNITISINYGKELYSTLGKKPNNKKDFVFFGNVVSKCKKMISCSNKKTKVIMSNTAYQYISKLEQKYNFYGFKNNWIFGSKKFRFKKVWFKY